MLYRLWSRALSLPARWSRPQAKQKHRSATSPDRSFGGWRCGFPYAKVIFSRRVRVIRVVPRRSLRVQGPREAVVRLPPRQVGPPGEANPEALQPPPAHRGGGGLEQRLPVRRRRHREDPHREAVLPRLPEVRLGVGPGCGLGRGQLPPADGGRRGPPPTPAALRPAFPRARLLDRGEDGEPPEAPREAQAAFHRDPGRGRRPPEEKRVEV